MRAAVFQSPSGALDPGDRLGRLAEEAIDVAILSDEASIAYLAGFWGYLSAEFGRPTFLKNRAAFPGNTG